MEVRIILGIIIIVITLIFMLYGAAGLLSIPGAIAVAIILNTMSSDGFEAFWGIDKENFILFIVIFVSALFAAGSDSRVVHFLGNLIAGAGLILLGLMLSGLVQKFFGEAVFMTLVSGAIALMMPIIVLTFLLMLIVYFFFN